MHEKLHQLKWVSVHLLCNKYKLFSHVITYFYQQSDFQSNDWKNQGSLALYYFDLRHPQLLLVGVEYKIDEKLLHNL